MEYTPKTNMALDDVLITTPLDGVTEDIRSDSPFRIKTRAIDQRIAAGTDPEQTVDDAETSILKSKEAIGSPTTQLIQSTVNTQEDPVDAANKIRESLEKEGEFKQSDDFILESALTISDGSYSPAMVRLVANQQLASEILEEKFKNTSTSSAGKIWDWTDRYVLRGMTIGIFEDLTKRSERKGREIATAAASMNSTEFKEWFQVYADELASEGFFTGENFYALQDALFEAENAGFDPHAFLNQVLAVAEIAPVVRGASRLGLKSTSAITRAGNATGPKQAAKAVESLEGTVLRNEPVIQVESGPRQLDPSSNPSSVKPTYNDVAKIAEENEIIKKVQYLTDVGTFGRMATKEEVDKKAKEIVSNLRKIEARPIADEDIVDVGLGRKQIVIKLGKMHSSAPFKSEAAAKKFQTSLMDRGLASKVVQVDPDDVAKGYYIEVRETIDLTRSAERITSENPLGFIGRTLSKYLASAATNDVEKLNSLAYMGEAGVGAIRTAVAPYLKQVRSLSFDSKLAIGAVVKDLRDGGDAYLRPFYSESEFIEKFRQYHPKGSKPSQKDIDGYYALQTLNDAAYILSAHKAARNYVTKGYKTIDVGGGVATPAKVFKGPINPKEALFNIATGSAITKSDLADDVAIWKLDRPLDNGIEYVAQPSNVRNIEYHDVLGYNAGGRRTNPDANYFVTLGDPEAPRAMLTTFSRNQAIRASKQIEEIRRAIKASGKKVEELTDELDDVIKRNNDWNPSLENTADLVALSAKKGWKFDDFDVSYKKRDDIVESREDLFNGMKMDEYIQASNKRSDQVLMEYGGNETFNYNPVKAVIDQMSSAASEYSFHNYTYNAKVSWLKKALRTDELPSGAGLDQLFRDTTAKGADAKRMAELKAIIERRGAYSSPSSKAMQNFGEDLSEWVMDKTGKKTSLGDPSNALLKLGFTSAFGFMNTFQFFLQASHAFAVIAISPKAGLKAAMSAIPIRAVLYDGGDEAVRRLAKVMNEDESFVKDMLTYIRTSGRDIVENDAIQSGTGAAWGNSGYEGTSFMPSTLRKTLYQTSKVAAKADEIGKVPFTAGERLSRVTSMTTAILEYRRKFPNSSVLSDDARTWITTRDQNLSFNMTTNGRAAWQQGLLRVPSQWMSYMLRSMETLFVGRGMTKAERIRLGLYFTVSGGFAGFGLAAAVDSLSEQLGVDPTGIGNVTLKYGVLDGALSWAFSDITDSDVRTAIGTRISPLAGILDLARKFQDDNALKVIGGPSAEIIGGGGAALFSAVGNLLNGYEQSSMEDVKRALRTPSGVDNVVKAIGIMNNGVYRSKTGTTLDADFSDTEAILVGLGVTNFKVADFYERKRRLFRESKEVGDFAKDITKRYQVAISMVNSGDVDGGTQLIKELSAQIEVSGFSPSDQIRLRRALKQDSDLDSVLMAIEYMRKQNRYGAEVVESYKIKE